MDYEVSHVVSVHMLIIPICLYFSCPQITPCYHNSLNAHSGFKFNIENFTTKKKVSNILFFFGRFFTTFLVLQVTLQQKLDYNCTELRRFRERLPNYSIMYMEASNIGDRSKRVKKRYIDHFGTKQNVLIFNDYRRRK